jgi:hypothetical protein
MPALSESKQENFPSFSPTANAAAIDADFPEARADELAARELFNKHLFRPNTYLHKWWARRAGTIFRHILKQLAADSARRDFLAPGGLEGITILDPMMGGGTTLHEALRLGANVIGADIDPIPVLQAKASLAESDLSEREEVFARFWGGIKSALDCYFRSACPVCGGGGEAQFILHGAKRRINGEDALVVDSFIIREEEKRPPVRIDDFYPRREVARDGRVWRLMEKKEGAAAKREDQFLELPFWSRYEPLIIVGRCMRDGLFYKAPDKADLSAAKNARLCADKAAKQLSGGDKINKGPKSDDLIKRNIRGFSELFSPRQRLYLLAARRALRCAPPAHRLWLALLISASLEFNCMLCGHKGVSKRRSGAIRHVFSHHAYSFPATALENNPVFSGRASGNLRHLFDSRIKAAGKWARAPVERFYAGGKWQTKIIAGETDGGRECESPADFAAAGKGFVVRQCDSARLDFVADGAADFVVTDPPYFDSVQYGDLSRFFRRWLAWLLPAAADWHYEAHNAAIAESDNSAAHYGKALGMIWKETARTLRRPHGRLIFTYHHWRPSAWTALSHSLQSAGFALVNYYVVKSEHPISVHIRDLRALRHDAILVLAPVECAPLRRWHRPSPAAADSRAFCRTCAKMLGWVLQNNPSDDDMARAWRETLEVIENHSKIYAFA